VRRLVYLGLTVAHLVERCAITACTPNGDEYTNRLLATAARYDVIGLPDLARECSALAAAGVHGEFESLQIPSAAGLRAHPGLQGDHVEHAYVKCRLLAAEEGIAG